MVRRCAACVMLGVCIVCSEPKHGTYSSNSSGRLGRSASVRPGGNNLGMYPDISACMDWTVVNIPRYNTYEIEVR